MPEGRDRPGYGCLFVPAIFIGILAGAWFRQPSLGLVVGTATAAILILALFLRDNLRHPDRDDR